MIAMKTMGGVGRASSDPKFKALLAESRYKGSSPATAMVKWLMANPNLTAAVIATNNFDQLQENAAAARQSLASASDRARFSASRARMLRLRLIINSLFYLLSSSAIQVSAS